MAHTILTMTRGDESRIEEWVRYHATLGFDEFHFILDAPIDRTEDVLRALEVDAKITIDIREPQGDYYDNMTPAERWTRVKQWRIDHADEIAASGMPANDALAMRNYQHFPPVLETYAQRNDGWLALIDVDEYIVLQHPLTLQELTTTSNQPRIRLLNFNFDMSHHVPGTSVLGNTMRWDREDILAYGKGWQNRVKSIVRYVSLVPMVSVHQISRGPFVTVNPEIGRLHHYRPVDQGIAELPYSVEDTTLRDYWASR